MKIKILFKIISIMILLIIIFPYAMTMAAEVVTVGNAIGTFALNYYNEAKAGNAPIIAHPLVVFGGWPSSYKSDRAIDKDTGLPKANPYSAKISSAHYGLDCVGWVNFCIYNATGISESVVHDGSGGYVVPISCSATVNRTNFELKMIGGSELSELQTGDIAVTEGHVMVYVNNGGTPTFIHSWAKDGPVLHTWDNLPSKYKGKLLARARVKKEVANLIDESSLNINPSLGGESLFGSGIEESEFYYNGVPDGRYSVADSFWMVIVDALKDIFTFLVNILFYIIRMVFVGFTAIFELLLTYILESIAGESNLKIDTTTTESSGNITVESIIFNRVNIFDVNFFKQTSPAATTP